jgi:Dolichyl-phosphate-mannose-protein mannosyltransferase
MGDAEVGMDETIEPERQGSAGPPPATDRRRTTLLGLALFALAFWHFLTAVDDTPFHRDEARWIYHAAAVRNLRHPLSPAWADSVRMQDQPPLAGYVFGIGLLVQGRQLGTVGWWEMGLGDTWNAAHGDMPSRAELFAARRTDAFLGALAVATVFFLVARLANLTGAVAGALFLVFHPLMTYLSSLTDSDVALVLLVALVALAATRLADRPTWPRAVLVGLLLGLGGAAKLSPLFIAPALAGLGIVVLARSRSPRAVEATATDQRLGWMLLAQPLVAMVVFVAVSPYLWRDPIGHTEKLFAFRAQEMANQRQLWPELRIDSPLEALGRIWGLLGVNWTTSGWLAAQLNPLTGASWRPQGLDLGLGVAGLAILIGLAVRRGPASPHALAVLVVGAAVAITGVGLRVYFERYLLPLAFALTVGVGVLTGIAWSALARRHAGIALPLRSGRRGKTRGGLIASAADHTHLPIRRSPITYVFNGKGTRLWLPEMTAEPRCIYLVGHTPTRQRLCWRCAVGVSAREKGKIPVVWDDVSPKKSERCPRCLRSYRVRPGTCGRLRTVRHHTLGADCDGCGAEGERHR